MSTKSKHGGLITFQPTKKLNEDGFVHHRFNGKMYPPFIDLNALKELRKQWHTDENDIFITTHQKVGTHLTKKFVSELLRKGHDYPSTHPIASGDIGHHTIPWPEVMASQYGLEHFFEFVERTKGHPRVWYVHCFLEDLPCASIHPKTKFIHVFRDPKGAAVSQYFFYKSHPLLEVSETLNMDDFISYFTAGDLYFGDYHEHTLNWTQPTSNNSIENQLLIMRYEDLVERKMASAELLFDFLVPNAKLSTDDLEEIIAHTDFQKMKQGITENPGSFHFNPATFFRSGTTYDWQEKLTEEQIAKIDAKSTQRWSRTDQPELSNALSLYHVSI